MQYERVNIGTKNMFLESCFELKLNLAEDLNIKSINTGYDIFMNEYRDCKKKQLTPPFELSVKAMARDYLLNIIHTK